MRDNKDRPPSADAGKQPAVYVTPRLVTYGALPDITRAVGMTSMGDGGAVAGMMMSAP